MKPLRVAVVGAGHLGRIHARIAAGLEEIELVAVADPIEATRTSVAQEAHTRGVADYRELIGEIEAAIIATPTCYHHSVGMELLNCGVPLLVEKPLALSAVEANELVTLAREMNIALQVGHVERFNPALTAVAADVRDPKYIDAARTSGYTFRSTDIGVVLDVMIHDLDIVLSLAKSTVEDVQALGISVLGGHEDMATARLTFASGCVAQLSASRVSFQQQRTMSVFTSRGSASINFATYEAAVVKPCDEVLRRQFRADQLSADERAYWKEHVFDELLVRSLRDSRPVNAIQEEQRDFVAAVRTGKTPRVDGAAGRDAVAVAEMILERIEEHAWDGMSAGRHGPFAMPALPIIAGTMQPAIDRQERRRAG
ncbi:MAG TPA: Gfo/Idh/MocA family oxidoreductase [Lacipirellulaceae bacterium]|nr:Gfo/Idh/MocA family oxidoreductase [Lacipirellulaceae bacterium]